MAAKDEGQTKGAGTGSADPNDVKDSAKGGSDKPPEGKVKGVAYREITLKRLRVHQGRGYGPGTVEVPEYVATYFEEQDEVSGKAAKHSAKRQPRARRGQQAAE
jgi:hypothetical protein